MTQYEYKVVPAPSKARKVRGVKGAEAKFARMLQDTMNELAADGWEYLRADLLPSEERQGLTTSQTIYRSVLVFRRSVPVGDEVVHAVGTARVQPRKVSVASETEEKPATETVPDTDPETSNEETRV